MDAGKHRSICEGAVNNDNLPSCIELIGTGRTPN